MNDENTLLRTDVYKIGHARQYPDGIEVVYSALVARSSKVYPASVVFGGNFYLKDFLVSLLKPGQDDMFLYYADAILGKGTVKPEQYRALVKLGYWPLKIKSLPEGTLVKNGNVLMTIVNTDRKFPWAVGFVEGLLLKVWNTGTVATNSFKLRKVAEAFALHTTGGIPGIEYAIHDFGYRGCSSEETAALGGAAHLLSFKGSDTVTAVRLLDRYYNADRTTPVDQIANSVPASEHSVMCAFGEHGELDAFHHMLDLYPTGIVSIVSDSYNFWDVVTKFIDPAVEGSIYQRVIERDGKTVFRPDCYDSETEILTKGGWLKFANLSEVDEVAQYSNGFIDFIKPSRIVNEPYEGDMVHFTNGKGTIDLLVTPNHRMVSRSRVTGKLRVAPATDIHYHDRSVYLAAGNGIGDGISHLSSLERLLIAFQADGSYVTSQKPENWKLGQRFSVRFNFTKERKWKRLVEICEAGGFEHKISAEPARPENRQITVWLDSPVEKRFIDWVKPLGKVNEGWAKEFVEELSYWDATRRSSTRFKYDTTVGENAELVQQIALLGGYRTSYSVHVDERKAHFSDVHCVHIVTRDFHDGQGINAQIVPYKGTVHCVSVPSGLLVVRRNRKVSISGNSGHPELVILGDPNAPEGSPERAGALELLWARFGGTVNQQGFRVLNPKVGLIYGDGIYYDRMVRIYAAMVKKGFATSNIVFGIGGLLLQQFSRDVLGYAIKATYVEIAGQQRNIMKDPITDPGKRSHKGLVRVDFINGVHVTRDQVSWDEEDGGLLETVFINGKITKEYNLQQIRQRLQTQTIPAGFVPTIEELLNVSLEVPLSRDKREISIVDEVTALAARYATRPLADQHAFLNAIASTEPFGDVLTQVSRQLFPSFDLRLKAGVLAEENALLDVLHDGEEEPVEDQDMETAPNQGELGNTEDPDEEDVELPNPVVASSPAKPKGGRPKGSK